MAADRRTAGGEGGGGPRKRRPWQAPSCRSMSAAELLEQIDQLELTLQHARAGTDPVEEENDGE